VSARGLICVARRHLICKAGTASQCPLEGFVMPQGGIITARRALLRSVRVDFVTGAGVKSVYLIDCY